MKKSLLTAATAAAVALMFAGCEKTPEEKLIKGIETGDAVLVQQAIEENVKLPAAKDSQGRSPHDLLEIKKNALIAGILNDYFKQNTIALGRAKTAEEAKAIIEKGAGMGLISSGRNPSALHVAVRENNTEMVKYLITSCGFDVNLHDDKVMPPLAWAVRADNVDMAKLLISKGASLKLLGKYAYSLGPRTSIDIARVFDEGDKKVAQQRLKQLIRRTETCVKIGWMNPLKIFQESRVTDKEFLKTLIKLGMPINAKNIHGVTPFAYAILFNDDDWANVLLSKGANINDCLEMVFRAEVSDERKEKWCKLLLGKGADPNTRIGDKTVLAYALEERWHTIAALLLGKGADPNTRIGNEPVLAYELKEGRYTIASLLVAKGADPNTKVDGPNTKFGGETALAYVIKNIGHHQYGNENDDESWVLVVKFLLDKGADPNTEINGITALRYVKHYLENRPSREDRARVAIGLLREHGARE